METLNDMGRLIRKISLQIRAGYNNINITSSTERKEGLEGGGFPYHPVVDIKVDGCKYRYMPLQPFKTEQDAVLTAEDNARAIGCNLRAGFEDASITVDGKSIDELDGINDALPP